MSSFFSTKWPTAVLLWVWFKGRAAQIGLWCLRLVTALFVFYMWNAWVSLGITYVSDIKDFCTDGWPMLLMVILSFVASLCSCERMPEIAKELCRLGVLQGILLLLTCGLQGIGILFAVSEDFGRECGRTIQFLYWPTAIFLGVWFVYHDKPFVSRLLLLCWAVIAIIVIFDPVGNLMRWEEEFWSQRTILYSSLLIPGGLIWAVACKRVHPSWLILGTLVPPLGGMILFDWLIDWFR